MIVVARIRSCQSQIPTDHSGRGPGPRRAIFWSRAKGRLLQWAARRKRCGEDPRVLVRPPGDCWSTGPVRHPRPRADRRGLRLRGGASRLSPWC